MKAKCLNPQTAWLCGLVQCKSDGVFSPHMVFSFNEAFLYWSNVYGKVALREMEKHQISVPCGKCMACQIRKRKDWTTRLSHEASMHGEDCCFITLTYDEDNVPVTSMHKFDSSDKLFDRGSYNLPLQTLMVSDVQKFMKRLRRHLEYVPQLEKNRVGRDHVEHSIRYYLVGEYGGKFGRPHYHLLIFGWKPSDMVFFKENKGHVVYRSSQIEKLWKYGFSTVEPVEGGVARYCSRYVTKKFARLKSDDPFKGFVLPEFYLQSIKEGGIGAPWFDKYYREMFARGYTTIRNGDSYVKCSVPAYYWNRCRKRDLVLWCELRDERLQFARDNPQLIGFDDLVRSCEVYEQAESALRQQELF